MPKLMVLIKDFLKNQSAKEQKKKCQEKYILKNLPIWAEHMKNDKVFEDFEVEEVRGWRFWRRRFWSGESRLNPLCNDPFLVEPTQKRR